MRIAGTQPVRQRRPRLVDDAYRKHVASQPCMACGISGRSQAAHITVGNYARGMKPDDNLCIPLCGTWNNYPGCHDFFDGRAGRFKSQRGFSEQILQMTIDALKAHARGNYQEWKQQQDPPDDRKHMD